ncbi:MAG: hypothetical protein WDW36_001629 [Sanguina aurantia]
MDRQHYTWHWLPGIRPGSVVSAPPHANVAPPVLQQSSPPADVELSNKSGQVLGDLITRVMDVDLRGEPPLREARGASAGQEYRDWDRGDGGDADGGGGGLHGAASWEERLREQCSDDEGGGWGRGHDACPGSEGDSPSYRATPAAGSGAADGPESEDAWADRMWRDMGARRRQAVPRAREGAGGAEARAAAKETAAARRRAAEAAVFESARILKEEQTKDTAWRRRATQGQAAPVPPDMAALRSVYESRWKALDQQLAVWAIARTSGSSATVNTTTTTTTNTINTTNSTSQSAAASDAQHLASSGSDNIPALAASSSSSSSHSPHSPHPAPPTLRYQDIPWPLPPARTNEGFCHRPLPPTHTKPCQEYRFRIQQGG